MVEESSEDQGLKTSAGCECQKESTCAEHGRDFKWCQVKVPNKEKGIKCPLYWDPTAEDAAGNDHRVAGAGVPAPMWDYCRLGQPEDVTDPHQPQQDPSVPAFAHRGCKCGFRGDLLGKYANNPIYKDKAGKFDWSRVPWSDRLGLEAMVVHYFRNSLAHDPAGGAGAPESNVEHICVRTPSSGSLHVCPATNANEDGDTPKELGDPGWCGSHSWDFCVPSQGDEAGGESAASEMEDSAKVGEMDATASTEPEDTGAVTSAIDLNVGLALSMAQQQWSTSVQDARKRSRQHLGLAFL